MKIPKGRALLFLVLGAGLGTAEARAEAPVAELPSAKAEAVEAAVSATMSRAGIPGASVAIALAGRLRFAQGYGTADLENGVPARAGTMYRLASVSKPITAAAVLKLVDEGRLDLDAPVQRYVPTFPEKAWPVSARQLLTHMGGVRHYRDDEPTNTLPCGDLPCALAFFKDDPLVVEPGTRYVYSTYGYNLLGAAIEGASRRPYLEQLREAIFTPAGMASIRPDEVRPLIPGRAQGYVRRPTGEILNSGLADVSYKVPGGGFIATASDVARFGEALVTGRLLSKESLAAMLTPQREKGQRATGYGLGLNVAAPGGKRREAWHTGGQERVSTVLFLFPDDGVSVAVLTNLEGVGNELVTLGRRLAEIVNAPDPAAPSSARR
ncbi:MAG TPA: serine hydrolase domain-containing protein [Vicinamibacteria bacterium]